MLDKIYKKILKNEDCEKISDTPPLFSVYKLMAVTLSYIRLEKQTFYYPADYKTLRWKRSETATPADERKNRLSKDEGQMREKRTKFQVLDHLCQSTSTESTLLLLYFHEWSIIRVYFGTARCLFCSTRSSSRVSNVMFVTRSAFPG